VTRIGKTRNTHTISIHKHQGKIRLCCFQNVTSRGPVAV